MKRIICILSVILFLVFVPGIVQNRVHEDVYTIENREKSQRYIGNLSVWHIVTFKTGAKSGLGFLRERADKFEQSNAHLFIDVIGMTAQEALERLEQGETPDIVSYPLGFFTNGEEFLPLEIPENMLDSFKKTGEFEEQNVALAYMADSYALISNENLLEEYRIRISTQPTYEEFISALEELSKNSVTGVALGSTANSAGALLNLRYEAEGVSAQNLGYYGVLKEGTEDFLKSEVGFYVAPFAEYESLVESENELNLDAIGMSDFTDLVQMISVTETSNDAKADMCVEFVENLFRDGVQGELADMKMIRTTKYDEVLGEEVQRIGEFGMVPNAFDVGAGWEEYKQSSYDAVLGDVSAKNIAAQYFTVEIY